MALETSGYAPWAAIAPLLPFVGLFLYDWKITDPETHRRWTGADNRLIRENLQKLCAAGAQIVLRCPVIPGVNDTPSHFEGIAALTKALPGIRRVDLLPYHRLGNSKRLQLSLAPDGFPAPDAETVSMWHARLSGLCAVPVNL